MDRAAASFGVFFCLSVFGLPGRAMAQSEPKKEASETLPVNPFADAKAGDWEVIEATSSEPGRQGEWHPFTWRVLHVAEGTVAASCWKGGRIHVKQADATIPIADLFADGSRRLPLTGVTELAAEAKTVTASTYDTPEGTGDRRRAAKTSFQCRKFTAKLTDGLEGKLTIWISKEVPAAGIVALKLEFVEHGKSSVLEGEVAGFGRQAWGESADAGENSARVRELTDEVRGLRRQLDELRRQPAPSPKKGTASETPNFWADVAVGTSVEYLSVTDMKKPVVMKSELTQTQTLSSKDAEGYALETRITMNGTTMPATEMKARWNAESSAQSGAPKVESLGSETITVPAGSFECQHFRTVVTDGGLKTTSESWVMKGLVVKAVTTNENMTSTMTMTKLEKK